MRKLLLMSLIYVTSNSVWAQETLQTVTSRGSVSIRDMNNVTFQNATNGLGRLFLQFNNFDGSRRGYMGYADAGTNSFFLNTDDGSPVNIQNRLLINNPPIDNANEGLQIKSGLSIYGSVNNLGSHINFRRSEGYEMAYIGWDDESQGNSPFVIKSSNGNDIKFIVNTREALRITENGNLGIGISSPNDKLAVNGNIRAKEVKVETSSWPDYVFTKSYLLPTLQEIESHIKEKGHLPGIPSAAEVKSNGIDLGEMNAKLLQKVEELTLHLIEQQKDIIAQKDENYQMHKRVALLEDMMDGLKKKER